MFRFHIRNAFDRLDQNVPVACLSVSFAGQQTSFSHERGQPNRRVQRATNNNNIRYKTTTKHAEIAMQKGRKKSATKARVEKVLL